MRTVMNLLFPSPFTSTHILVGVLVFAIFGIFGFVVYKVIKTEKKATTQRKAMKVGDIVYCKVKGNYYTHLVKATNSKRGVLIGNNRGGINGWTKAVYGKVVKILEE